MPAQSQPSASDLLISEYVEGSSNNKALELYNGTGVGIDLAAGGYVIQMYFNGSTTAGLTINLTGTVAAGDVFVLAQSSANAVVLQQADQTSSASWFNGDDAIALRKGGAAGVVVDSVGQIGVDPGTEWGSALTSTADNTLRLRADVLSGDTNPNDVFDPSARFEGFATDTFGGLGAHEAGTPPPPPPPGAPVVTVAADDGQAREGVDSSFSFILTRTGATDQPLTVSYALGGSAIPGVDHSGAASGQVTFAAGSATTVLNLTALDDTIFEVIETVGIRLVDGEAYDLGAQASAIASIESDDVGVTRISAIQGSGGASSFAGTTSNPGPVLTVEAVIVGDFQNGDDDNARNLGGFFLQEEFADEDGNGGTSEGLFAFQGDGPSAMGDLTVGTKVRVTGTVVEEFGRTQFNVQSVQELASGALGEVRVAELNLPNADLEAYEGMLIAVPQKLVVASQDDLDRLGEIRLYATEGDGLDGKVDESSDGRAYQFTQTNDPSRAGFAAHQAEVASRTIIYDDGANGTWRAIQNPNGGGLYNTANAIQNGDSITGLAGMMDYGFGAFRIRSVEDGVNTFVDTNPREAAPADVGGSLIVASFNVLNFFVTPDDGSRTDNGQEPRGANSEAEFARQTEKLVTTITALDADILGLIELENDFNSSGVTNVAGGNALGFLVERLNQALGGDVYSYIEPGREFVGTDAIAVGFIYKNDVVAVAEGTVVAIDYSAVHDRPPVAVTFEELATGGQFTAVVNHFKSKGSGSGVNADQGDGQARSNPDRVAQAQALLAFLATNPTQAADPDVLLLGDFNAYYREDPINVLRSGGYEALGGETSYSYTFDGQLGSLDHILPGQTLQAQVTGSTKWHVNADEANVLDYNLDADDRRPGLERDPSIFNGRTPFSVSDHDPVLVGLNLKPTDKVLNGAAGNDVLLGKNGDDTLNGGGGDDALSGGLGNDILTGGLGDDELIGGDGQDTAVFAGARSAYRVGLDEQGRIVVAGPDGRDVATGVERFSFDDGVLDALAVLNDAPIAQDDAARSLQDRAVQIAVLANDDDGDAELTQGLTVVSAFARNGTAAIGADGVLTYQPNEGFLGRDLITYVLSDGSTLTDTGEVSVEVYADRTGFVLGTAGADAFAGGNGADLYAAGDGNDTVRGENGDDRLYGEMGDDLIFGGNGADRLFGDAGADVLRGENGNDVLAGSGGADILHGDRGADRLTGGSGADVFVFGKSAGDDRITDFEAGVDRFGFEDGVGVRSIRHADVDADGVTDTLVQLTSGSAALLGVELSTDGSGWL